jgi:chromosomal replication initiator protein
MNSFSEIFDLVKTNIDVPDLARTTWINPIKPVKLVNNTAVLCVQAPFVKQILQDNYTELFKKQFKEILGFDVNVEFQCCNELSHEDEVMLNPITELQDDKNMVKKLTTSELNSNYRHTFDTFITGESNKLAFAACKAVAEGINTSNPLYIYGDPGLGKTHLLTAVKNEFNQIRPQWNVGMFTADTFITDYVKSLSNRNINSSGGFKDKYRNLDVLLIDDVQFFAGKIESQQELFNTFNDLHGAGKPIILTSDRVPKEITGLEERLQSRFIWGILADISSPGFETRLAILQRKADLFNLEVPPPVMNYIADRIKKNIRQLEGAINKMNALSLVEEISPNMAMAQSVIKEILEESVPTSATVERVINEVASIYGFTPEEIRGKKRNANLSTARQIAMYVVQTVTGITQVEIGRQFGGRDHSTIVYAISKVEKKIKDDKAYRHTIDDLIKNVGNL